MSLDALRKEVDGLRDLRCVSEVARGNQKSAAADTVGSVADSQSLLGREVGNLAVLLFVASVSVKHDTSHLGLGRFRQASDGSNHDGCALRIATTHDDGVRAFAGSQIEHLLSLAVGSGTGAVSRKSVGSETGCVGASDTLACYLAREFLLEAAAGRRTKGRALVIGDSSARGKIA